MTAHPGSSFVRVPYSTLCATSARPTCTKVAWKFQIIVIACYPASLSILKMASLFRKNLITIVKPFTTIRCKKVRKLDGTFHIAVRSRDSRVSYRWPKITFQHGNRERFIHAFRQRGEREVIVKFSVTKQSLDRMVKENYLSRTQTASASRQQQIHTWLSFLSQWFGIVIFGTKEISSSYRDSYDFTSISAIYFRASFDL